MSGELEKMQPGAQQTSGIHLWLVLWKAFYALQARAMADIECLGLCLSDFGILELLLHKGPMPVNEIGCKVKLTSGSMTVAIDRLERKRLVERRKDDRDARTRIIHLTEAGCALIEPAFRKHAEVMNQLGEILTQEEREEAIRLLKKLGTAAQGHGVPCPVAVEGKPTT
jgi:MarR family 2-MHQ and catechol resistance regulon transcriptional repressor